MTPDSFRKTTMITKPRLLSFPFDGEDDKDKDKPSDQPKPVEFTPEQQALFDERLAKETEGLRSTNAALKGEKTTAKDAHSDLLKSLGGEEGVKALTEMRERLAKDETTKLLSEGKHEEWFNAKVGPLRAEHESQLNTMREERDAAVKSAEDAVAALQDKVLEVDVSMAAISAKVENTPGVIRDINRAAREVFKWNPEHKALVREEGGVVVFGKDAKTPQTVAEWLPTQQEDSRHWWGKSVGSDSKGSKGSLANGQVNPWSKDGWNLTNQGAFVKEHGRERADQIAASVGSKVGATKPPA